MSKVILISSFDNPFEIREVEDKLNKLNLKIKSRLNLEDFSIEYFRNIELSEILVLINAKDQRIKALEICKKLKNINQEFKIMILLEEIKVEESNIFGFYQAYVSSLENFEHTIPKILFNRKLNKSKKVILFASNTESERDSFETVLSFAKYLSINNKKILLLENSQSQLINNSLNSHNKESLYDRRNNFNDLEADFNYINVKPIEKIPNCDYLARILQSKHKIEFINNIGLEIEKLNDCYRNTEVNFKEKIKFLDELDEVVSKLKSETTNIERFILKKYENRYEYILVELGSDLVSHSSRYFYSIAEEMFININNTKSNFHDFLELKDYLSKSYNLKLNPITANNQRVTKQITRKVISKEPCINSDLYKFLRTNQLKEKQKNKAQDLAERIYKHLEINNKSEGELCH